MDIYPGKTDKLLFEDRSPIQELKVLEKLSGYRYLLLNGVQHGGNIPGQPGRLVLPYFKLATAALAFTERHRDFLMVGLGNRCPAVVLPPYPAGCEDRRGGVRPLRYKGR